MGLFFYFHVEMLNSNLLSERYQYTGTIKFSIGLCLCYYQRGDYILYLSFPISMFLEQEMVNQSY